MRKSVISAVIVALLANQAVAADWKHVATSPASATLPAMKWYIAPEAKSGTIIKQEVLLNLDKPVDTERVGGTRYVLASSLISYEFDCLNKGRRTMNERHYSELNGGGIAQTSRAKPGEWEYGVSSAILDSACKQVAAVTPAPTPAPAPTYAPASNYNPDPTNASNSTYASTSGPSGSEVVGVVGDVLSIALTIGGALLGGYNEAKSESKARSYHAPAPAIVPAYVSTPTPAPVQSAPTRCTVRSIGDDARVSCY